MGFDVIQLGDNVFLYYVVDFIGFVSSGFFFYYCFCGIGIVQLVRYCWYWFKVLIGGDCFYCVVVGMVVDYDICYVQCNYGIFDGCGNVVWFWFERWYDIFGIMNDKELFWFLLGNQFWYQMVVRIGDEKCFGILVGGQVVEEFFMLGEDFFLEVEEVFNDMLYSSVFFLQLLWYDKDYSYLVYY